MPTQSRLDVARTLAAKGFRLFPLVQFTNEKGETAWRPALKKFADKATTDEAQLEEWFADGTKGIALLAGDGLLIVDLDTKNGKDGKARWDELDLTEGCTPTMTLQTSSGGEHWFYSVGEPVGPGVSKIAVGIDHRGDGSYVRIHDQLFKASKLETPIAAAPQWLMQYMTKPRDRADDADETPEGVQLDTEYNVSRAIDFIESRGPSLDGERNVKAFQIASDVRALGISRLTCRALMLDHWDCSLPIEAPDEFERTVNSAYDNAKTKIAANDPDAQFEAIEPEDAMRGKGVFRFSHLMSIDPKPIEELIPGLIEKHICTFLSGPGGSHKSRIAIQLGLSINAGIPVFGRQVEQSTFVYLSSEDDFDEVTRRTHAIAKRLGVPPSTGLYWDRHAKNSAIAVMAEGADPKLTPFYAELRDFLRSIPGHKFVALDSCYDYARFAAHAKIDEHAVNAFVKQVLGGLCVEADASILALSHPSQAGIDRGDGAGWSVAWVNAPRARLGLRKSTTAGGPFTLKVEKRNHGQDGEEIPLYWSNGALLPAESMDSDDKASRLRDACVSLVASCAQQGDPVQKQRKLQKWQIDLVEAAVGFRPSDADIKNEIGLAAHAGALTHMAANRHRRAGYYPVSTSNNVASNETFEIEQPFDESTSSR